jgi:hypothetical protein
MLNIHDLKAAYEQAIGHKTSDSTIPRASAKKLAVSQFECGTGPQVASIALVTYSRAAL